MYRPGWRILASDYNGIIGGLASDQPASSESAASGKIAAIWGIGYGRYGYGQSHDPWRLRLVRPTERLLEDDWARLQDAVSRMLLHMGLTSPDLPPADLFEIGDRVLVHDAGYAPGDWDAMLADLDDPANREKTYTSNPSSYSLVSAVASDTSNYAWGSSSISYISSEFIFRWPTGDHARAFFNAGGEIVIRTTHTPTTTVSDQRYGQFLNDIGPVRYGRDYFQDSSTVPKWYPSWDPTPRDGGYWNAPDRSTPEQFVRWRLSNAYPFPDNDLRMFLQHGRFDAANVSGNGDNGSILGIEVILGRPNSGTSNDLSPGTRVEVDLWKPKWLPDPDIVPEVLLYNSFDSAGPIITI